MLQGKQYQNSECTLVWLIARSFLLVDIFLLAPDSTHWTLTNSEEVMPGMVALPTFAHDALVICWLCSPRCLCSPMALRWGSIQLLLEWEKRITWKLTLSCRRQRNTATISHRNPPSLEGGSIGRAVARELSWLSSHYWFCQNMPVWLHTSAPVGESLPSRQMHERSQTLILFFWEGFFGQMLGRSADPPGWVRRVFSEQWVLSLSHLMKPQCYHWDFQLRNCHFTLWRNNKFLN